MQKEVISQKQFLEMLESGTAKFNDVMMQFFDIHGTKLRDVVFENCDINFCTFSDC
ncbi:MAG: hypothetical protein HYW27_02935, partial [Candidatus Aenigmarchaeota archaeon]|nr:hypothetical protein [Candidatus Aenigmarchaeota archaeon]